PRPVQHRQSLAQYGQRTDRHHRSGHLAARRARGTPDAAGRRRGDLRRRRAPVRRYRLRTRNPARVGHASLRRLVPRIPRALSAGRGGRRGTRSQPRGVLQPAPARAGMAHATIPRTNLNTRAETPTMGFLAGKRILILGLLSNRSIAYGIARACHAQGAELAFTYQGERFRDRVTEMAAEFGSNLVFPCDVAEDEQIATLFAELGKQWDGLAGLVHAVAFAPREAIAGDFLDGASREAFRVAHDISSYSFVGLAKAARPMMEGRNAALLTLSY